MKKTKKFKIPRALANRLTRISAYSIVLVAMTFLGLYAGLWLDRLTGMAPNFTLLLLILGIVLGFKGFIQEVVIERRKRA
ncbi:MAG: putative F0F1-ATPase [Deltaproteobacteria bacterium ADurb.BinA179]|jgi:F0F1-type ATP synthase assembly protein I|nr:AtpZ/AtpI family protein [Pseudomonadota bacterium]OPZ25384.1 MAG: putative F0F1-ATPase [Deltaproteobacteria bacterium ADurb.BinA179]HNU75379.1 AtpZ/AtpI family protein [Deltaproteobacteria bacterium]OPZ26369.1 MAG: putative F0F1-ATPase [Deltaproteobacteria bacterium ADurb.BinA179]HOD72363.1 AtpZ/AtpI family protein [Deltaproteobacteria bacterium]